MLRVAGRVDCIAIIDYNRVVASITIRNLDPKLKERLRLRAARHGYSMEREAREILQEVLRSEKPDERNLYERIRELFEPLGGVELELPPREPAREPPHFE